MTRARVKYALYSLDMLMGDVIGELFVFLEHLQHFVVEKKHHMQG